MTSAAATDFRASLAGRLAVIEKRLVAAAEADSPFVSEVARHLISSGGKRFRPMLVATGAEFGGPVDEEDLIKAALVVELTHVASLYHDDVMDGSDMRRGAPSANSRWDNSVAILVGDFLFSRASSIVAGLGTDFVKLQADTFARLVQGQIAETRGPQSGEDPVAHYLKVLADKTGSLIATSAVFGGMVAGASSEVLKALHDYGEEIGLVFQLSDDVIDITSDVTGKPSGIDLREGVPTMPTLLLRASTDPADAEVVALIDADLSSDEALTAARDAIRANPVIERVRNDIRRRADLAVSYLEPLPDGEAKQALIDVSADLVSRAV